MGIYICDNGHFVYVNGQEVHRYPSLPAPSGIHKRTKEAVTVLPQLSHLSAPSTTKNGDKALNACEGQTMAIVLPQWTDDSLQLFRLVIDENKQVIHVRSGHLCFPGPLSITFTSSTRALLPLGVLPLLSPLGMVC